VHQQRRQHVHRQVYGQRTRVRRPQQAQHVPAAALPRVEEAARCWRAAVGVWRSCKAGEGPCAAACCCALCKLLQDTSYVSRVKKIHH
jgi:hypothetical protein